MLEPPDTVGVEVGVEVEVQVWVRVGKGLPCPRPPFFAIFRTFFHFFF